MKAFDAIRSWGRDVVKRHRLLVYNTVVIVFIVLIQSDAFPAVLDSIMGVAWSADIVRILRLNTQGFIILLVIQLYLEGRRKDQFEAYLEARNHVLEARIADLLDASSAEDLMAYSLRKRLGNDSPDLVSLAQKLVPHRPEFLDSDVSFKLDQLTGQPDRYVLNYQLSFAAAIDEVLFAVAGSQVVQEALFASIPQLTEVTPLQRGETLTDAARVLRREVTVHQAIRSENATSRLSQVSLERVPAREVAQYLPVGSTLSSRDFALFTGKLVGGADERKKVILRMKRTLRLAENCLPWMSDRAIFLNSIVFDFTNFPGKGSFNFEVYPFLLVDQSAAAANWWNDRNDLLQISVHNWITPGQGILVSWQAVAPVTT